METTTQTKVIIAVSCATKALDKTTCNKFSAESVTHVLTATFAVKNSSFEPAVFLTKLFYGVYAEFLLHIITHFKSDYLAVIAVEYRRNIELYFIFYFSFRFFYFTRFLGLC